MPQSRIQLPNGCSRSAISVTPQNWKSLKKCSAPWRIHYRFYDPTRPAPKQVKIMTMNKFKDIGQRKHATELEIDTLEQILAAGYNPFLRKVIEVREVKYEIDAHTLFIPALRGALARVALEEKTRKEINNYIIENVAKAALHLNYHTLFISEVKRKHIVFILDHLRQTLSKFTDNTFNHFRKYLRILFSELTEIEAVESNIINDIKVKPPMEKDEKVVLTNEQRRYINDLLLTQYPEFHRFLHIFFHSGARITELMKVKGADVELEAQRYKTVIKKGRKPRIVWRTIKNIAMPFWREAMEGCQPDDYVFSKGLQPGSTQITSKQITRRWFSLVKKKFVYTEGRKGGKGKYVDRVHIINGKEVIITADFYSLKHLNTSETIDHLELQAPAAEATKLAAEHNAHTSTAMVVQIYDVKQQKRKHDRVKRVNNPFA
jgi:integrase